MKAPKLDKKMLGNRPVLAGMIAIALVALYGAAAFARPVISADQPGPRQVPILTSVVACPDPSSSEKVKTRVAAFTPAGGRGKGQAQITAVKPEGGAPLATLGNPGVAWFSETKDGEDPYAVRATGTMAGGLEVEQTSAASSGDSRGLAALRCAEPGIDTWFVGPGPVDAEKIELHLVNVDDQPAAVDIEALSQDGPIDTTETGGLSVKPHDSQVVTIGDGVEGLEDVSDDAQTIALRVQSRQGRVAANVRVRMRDGRGIDWVPAAGVPGTQLTVPGIPPGEGARQLLIAVPGETDARVTMQVITEKGVFAPEGRDILDAPAQTITRLDLDGVLNGKAAALRINADEPVVASLVAQSSVGGAEDIGMTAATPAISQRGALADLRAGEGEETKLIVTAPDQDAAVRVTTITRAGPAGAPQDVQLGSGRTAVVSVPAPQGGEDGYSLVVTPRSGAGPVYAARLLSAKKQGFTVLPVASARAWIPGPEVGDSVTAIIP